MLADLVYFSHLVSRLMSQLHQWWVACGRFFPLLCRRWIWDKFYSSYFYFYFEMEAKVLNNCLFNTILKNKKVTFESNFPSIKGRPSRLAPLKIILLYYAPSRYSMLHMRRPRQNNWFPAFNWISSVNNWICYFNNLGQPTLGLGLLEEEAS
jgi:hypothetical protein